MKKIFYTLVLIIFLLLLSKTAFAKDYSYEGAGIYILHHFKFSGDEIREIAKGPYKAREYSDWMLESIEKLSSDLGAGLKEELNKGILDFKLTSLASLSERTREDILYVELRSYDDGNNYWSIELYDPGTDTWKELTE